MSNATGYPKCRLCGAEHPLGGPHAWDKGGGSSAVEREPSKLGAEGSTPSRRSKSQPEPREASRRIEAGPVAKAENPKKRGRPSTGFDKAAYQRELMRKRRSK